MPPAATVMILTVLAGAAWGEVRQIVVGPGDEADFSTVQAAIDSVPEGNTEPVVIRISPGVYREMLRVPRGKPFITFLGEAPRTTILTYDNYASLKRPGTEQEYGTTGSSSTFIDADDFRAENITFANTASNREHKGQAVAIKTSGDRLFFSNCRFLGHQDTLYANGGREYYYKCYIEGGVDFIFGRAAAVFDDCHIHSNSNGYVTAQSRTEPDSPSGYVFVNCLFTGARGVEADLGRPWRDYARVVLLNCRLGEHIRPQGWNNWGRPEREQTAYYAEYNSMGPGGAPRSRVPWSHQLSEGQAAEFMPEIFLHREGKDNSWLENILATVGRNQP